MSPSVDEISESRGLNPSNLTILFVDDEPENLRVFELAFRRDFKIRTAQGAEEALSLLAEEPSAVILSDQRMPGMTGVEFLSRVREFDPDTIRMLVTAYGDNETLTDAINRGAINRYIAKPWNAEEMRIVLQQGLDAYARDADRRALFEELETINRAAGRLYSELEIVPVLDHLLELVVMELGFDGASVLLKTREGDALEVVRSAPRNSDVPAAIEGHKIPLASSPTLRGVVEERHVSRVQLGDLFDLDPGLRFFAAEVAAQELLFLSLPGRSGSLGVLAVDNRSGGVPFDHANRTLLTSLGAQASIAIDNAFLVEDLRRSHEVSRRADRLGTLGTLAAGLAHEINNPLVSIQTFLRLAPEHREASERNEEFWGDYHQLACREAARIHALVHTMSRLGSGTGSEPPPPAEALPVEDLLAEAMLLVEGAAREANLRVEPSVEPIGLCVKGVRDHLHQVVTNLLLNAVHASPHGGRVALRARPGEPGQVVLEVQDWGAGIPAELLDRVFDPFFTTKSPDEGSGLGLMISHRIVTDHGGTLEVASCEGQGSTFRLLLPAG